MATETTKLTFVEGAAASTPAGSRTVIYAKADGLMYSKDDAGVETLMSAGAGGMTNPMTTAGDIIVGGGSGAPARLAAGTAGYPLVGGGAGVASAYQALPTSGKVSRTAGDFVTTSSSFVDVTGMSVTITTLARRCLVVVTGTGFGTSGDESVFLGINIDGTLFPGTLGAFSAFSPAGNRINLSFSYVTAALTAASHTFKVQTRCSGTGITIDADAGWPFELSVVELFAA